MMESEQKDDMKQANQPNLNGATMQVGDEGHANSTNSEASSTSSSPRSHFHKYRNMDTKTPSPDFEECDKSNETEDPVHIIVGICAMNKKTYSRPMKEILKRLKRFILLDFQIFPDEIVLNEPVENWPVVDCLISFYSTGFPLEKAIAYAKLRKPLVINDLEMQYLLQDRREVYRLLEEEGLEIPRYAIFNRDPHGNPLSSDEDIEEFDDTIIVNGKTFTKPFVEKPVNAEDHNIYIYYPSSAGGGCQILFRKIGSRSSVYSSESRIRRTGSYIYEDFMPTDGTDVKVYTVGEEYAHAEARKSPVLDGKVERDSGGKELRYPVILSAHEKLLAKRVCSCFKQTVCGFDLLRANGKSLVCDVNGFSFVKTSQKYYDDCSQILADIILQNIAPQLWIPQELVSVDHKKSVEAPVQTPASTVMELRCVIAIIRHGDRTPKQKMKMVVTHPLFVKLFNKYGGPDEGRLKIKKPKQLQEILDITRTLLEAYEEDPKQPIHENKLKLAQMKSVLEMYGYFSGINRKVQLKAMADKRNYDMLTKFKGRNKKSQTSVGNTQALLLILKWGGELTPMGKKQAEDLGRAFRCVYPGGQGEYGRVPGFGFLRLHSTYRHDLKIYASDEGRVQMTAAAFAKGLLALEGELTPVLVSLVNSDKHVTGMLDTPVDVSGTMQRVKCRLHDHLHSTSDFTPQDEEDLTLSPNSILKAMREVKNPHQVCQKIYALVQELVKQINKKCDDSNSCPNKNDLYHDESLNLMKHRWEKLEKDFWSGDEFDISLIPDIYDCVKYDYLHNRSLGLRHLPELYQHSKSLADIVIPLEYGITAEEKTTISRQICNRFYRKIQADLQYNVNRLEDTVHRLDPSESRDIATPHRHVRTRLYITSESHVHSVVAALRYGNLFKDMTDSQWEYALEHLNHVSEFNYLTQIVLMQYEDPSADPLSEDRFHIELFFSPGVKTPDNEKVAHQLASESLENSESLTKEESLAEIETLDLLEREKSESSSEGILISSKDKKEDASRTSLDVSPKFSSTTPIRMSLQPMVERVNSTHHGGSSKNDIIASSAINPVEDSVTIQGADVIETLPSLHPLIRLHNNIGQNRMDTFFGALTDDLVAKDSTVDVKEGRINDTNSIPDIPLMR
ncbi:inositol hexakisphosphate and diphosphoinositol-pentakisphosphate kinase 2-like isoform X2 [Hydractinia symbiolongicarpus]|uniref:inositol hexakisphosphate and diphosphoinositol-pentakisphosphate kinase 2-like isoform X2 n=1 Tax=Hydractinia symbiolongicarpus TaxID=13093 RepID=UPI00254C5FF8|nr:inositol hexakisphosphate and diphosphoinositol-pentakisphosphate kinase 2-like isoform X2 [Hydractinia symbiolongicarpus]